MAQAGELMDAIAQGLVDESHIRAEIGEVLAGDAPGRTQERDITVYKSLGVAAQDLAAGLAAYKQANSRNLGIEVEW
jgi:ornithine cyclodeaminase